jgi:hypothetical protein
MRSGPARAGVCAIVVHWRYGRSRTLKSGERLACHTFIDNSISLFTFMFVSCVLCTHSDQEPPLAVLLDAPTTLIPPPPLRPQTLTKTLKTRPSLRQPQPERSRTHHWQARTHPRTTLKPTNQSLNPNPNLKLKPTHSRLSQTLPVFVVNLSFRRSLRRGRPLEAGLAAVEAASSRN